MKKKKKALGRLIFALIVEYGLAALEAEAVGAVNGGGGVFVADGLSGGGG